MDFFLGYIYVLLYAWCNYKTKYIRDKVRKGEKIIRYGNLGNNIERLKERKFNVTDWNKKEKWIKIYEGKLDNGDKIKLALILDE